MTTHIVNLFAGPGAGKSTTSAGVFNALKLKGERAEIVTEVAKDLVWEKRCWMLQHQLLILAEQDWRVRKLFGQVDYIVTDSPVLLSAAYAPEKYYKSFVPLCYEVFNGVEDEGCHNINIVIDRVKMYEQKGRVQNEDRARGMDKKIHELLHLGNIPHYHVAGNDEAVKQVLALISAEVKGL